jgi:hypothetical protein
MAADTASMSKLLRFVWCCAIPRHQQLVFLSDDHAGVIAAMMNLDFKSAVSLPEEFRPSVKLIQKYSMLNLILIIFLPLFLMNTFDLHLMILYSCAMYYISL